jgi:hypothetical protein
LIACGGALGTIFVPDTGGLATGGS